MSEVRVPVSQARETAIQALEAVGASPTHAATQVDLLIAGELRGHPSHGLLRLPRVIARIQAGVCDPIADAEITWTHDARAVIDGHMGLGAVIAGQALQAASARARQTGIAAALVHNSNHIGMLAYYAELIAQGGQILIAATTSEALVHPWGGRRAMVGTNPLAIGVPADEHPFVLDMATGIVSMGKIHAYAAEQRPLQPGWAVDGDGSPTTDARAAMTGAIAPFGDAKGYGLGIALEVLIGALTQSALGPEVHGTLDDDRVCNKGDVFIVIESTTPGARAISDYLQAVRDSPSSDPGSPISIPGDGSARRRAQNLQDGLSIPDALWSEIQRLADVPPVHERRAP